MFCENVYQIWTILLTWFIKSSSTGLYIYIYIYFFKSALTVYTRDKLLNLGTHTHTHLQLSCTHNALLYLAAVCEAEQCPCAETVKSSTDHFAHQWTQMTLFLESPPNNCDKEKHKWDLIVNIQESWEIARGQIRAVAIRQFVASSRFLRIVYFILLMSTNRQNTGSGTFHGRESIKHY